ncbi:4'-phosphopantetheinyl transferase [Fimbriiglobus ruber]|uniref:4'-phosphopantetheinyl transferase n=2 Tax=Fimbriiglobus ruber TaxID=1908690 RepID=A0A225DTB3_9BACT|nr:4'-phosphopantetheinyl transferase [Fimbriiglobus ruber]
MHVVVRTLTKLPVAPLVLPANEVHVWQAPFDTLEVRPDEFATVLVADERKRAERYTHARARDQFLCGRGLLRGLLGAYTGVAPGDVPITVEPDGKPALGEGGRGLLFNISHTDGVAVFAVAGVRVGVDVEFRRTVANADGLVERYFAPAERKQYQNLPGELQPAGFLRGWTCKEAVLKGLGCGIRGLDRAVVDLDPRDRPAVVGPPETMSAWAVCCWEPTTSHVAAVAAACNELIFTNTHD